MANSEAYPLHGGQLRQIAERFDIPLSELLDFSANINPAGPPPSVLSTLRASVNDPSTLTEYPDLQQTDLKQAVAPLCGDEREERNCGQRLRPTSRSDVAHTEDSHFSACSPFQPLSNIARPSNAGELRSSLTGSALTPRSTTTRQRCSRGSMTLSFLQILRTPQASVMMLRPFAIS